MFVDAGCHGLIRSCFGCGSQMDRWGDYDLTMWSLIYCQLSNLHFQKDNRWTFGPLLMWHQCSQRNFCSLFLRHTNSDTHAARWKWAVCVPIQCKSCRFFSAGNSRRVIDTCETLFVLVTEPHNAARRKRITQTDTAAHSGHICEGPCYSCWFSCASLCF